MSAQSRSRSSLFVVLVLALCVASCLLVGCGGSSNADSNLKAQSEPSNGAVLTGSSGGDAGVQVTASPECSTYVKVKTMSGATTVGFFVRAGSTAEVRVPPGTYSVQFASGDTWYGQNDRFGSHTSYGQDKSVSLGTGDVITYKLQRSSSGNFNMGSLNGSEF